MCTTCNLWLRLSRDPGSPPFVDGRFIQCILEQAHIFRLRIEASRARQTQQPTTTPTSASQSDRNLPTTPKLLQAASQHLARLASVSRAEELGQRFNQEPIRMSCFAERMISGRDSGRGVRIQA